jgi:hypothetical protein
VIAAVIGVGAAVPARASCPVTLNGDPDTVVRVAHALSAFGSDDAACVSLHATCSADPDHQGGIVLEVQDAFGRSTTRTVASIDGAVALLVSWSRRPLPFTPPPELALVAAPPAAETAVTAHPAAAPAASLDDALADHPAQPLFDHDRQLELRFQVIGAPEKGQLALNVDGAYVHRNGLLRYGVDFRLAETSGNNLVLPIEDVALDTVISFDATGVFGLVAGKGRWITHIEANLGAGVVGGITSQDHPVYQTQGMRVGARGGANYRLVGSLWLEVGLGWDGLLRVGPQSNESKFHSEWLATPHIDTGLLWVL